MKKKLIQGKFSVSFPGGLSIGQAGEFDYSVVIKRALLKSGIERIN